ncbi:hypothetical protein AB0L41_45060 [Amycolatopsis mediterranei]|uniref:hypothetical protein n=1 Tax=Amycolatopsis mediterranei TaxID=33910 RepID=UPI0034389D66
MTVQYPGLDGELPIHGIDLGTGIRPLVTEPPPRRLDARAYAADLAEGLTDEEPVDLVITQCMSTSIGVEVARLLVARGHRPLLVALDGAPCAARHVAGSYRDTLRRYRADSAGLAVTGAALRAHPADVLSAMRAELTGAATAALLAGAADAELVAPMVDDVVTVSMSWLGHLVAAHNAPGEPWPGETLVVTSRDTPFTGPWPAVPAPETVALDCAATELIGSDAVREVLRSRLAAWTGRFR